LAGSEDFLYVTIGGLLGHAVCTTVAVVGGKLLAERISVKTITLLGGILFIFFAISTLYNELGSKVEAVDSTKMPPGF
jgi:putative Ca2+/H+ antiporter (TMEM165/GDT1 family)